MTCLSSLARSVQYGKADGSNISTTPYQLKTTKQNSFDRRALATMETHSAVVDVRRPNWAFSNQNNSPNLLRSVGGRPPTNPSDYLQLVRITFRKAQA